MNTAILIGRLFFGLGLAAHGTQKLFGWFGGHGLTGTGGFFETLGFRPGRFFAAAAALGETLGGVLLAVGLFGPLGPALMFLVMIVATSIHVKNGFFATNNGFELPMLYAMGALVFAFIGPGDYSADQIFDLLWLTNERTASVAIGVAVVIGAVTIVASHTLVQPAAPAASS
jgi:putative oxidoreductase